MHDSDIFEAISLKEKLAELQMQKDKEMTEINSRIEEKNAEIESLKQSALTNVHQIVKLWREEKASKLSKIKQRSHNEILRSN